MTDLETNEIITQSQDLTFDTTRNEPLTPELVKRQMGLVQSLLKDVLRDGVHFGTVPGVDKPFLFQPGADKIHLMFNLMPRYEIVSKQETENLISYMVECSIIHRGTGNVFGTALACCNSREDKYRFKNIPEWKASESDKESAIEVIQKQGRNGNFTMYKVEIDPWAIQETLIAMAQKRAKVSATRNCLAVSDLFNIDEDMTAYFRNVEAPQEKTEDKVGRMTKDEEIESIGLQLIKMGMYTKEDIQNLVRQISNNESDNFRVLNDETKDKLIAHLKNDLG
tara:strand:+ start:661 stop:1503 length:843 start_codon:yes stop_codon:yes gene_type:complete